MVEKVVKQKRLYIKSHTFNTRISNEWSSQHGRTIKKLHLTLLWMLERRPTRLPGFKQSLHLGAVCWFSRVATGALSIKWLDSVRQVLWAVFSRVTALNQTWKSAASLCLSLITWAPFVASTSFTKIHKPIFNCWLACCWYSFTWLHFSLLSVWTCWVKAGKHFQCSFESICFQNGGGRYSTCL